MVPTKDMRFLGAAKNMRFQEGKVPSKKRGVKNVHTSVINNKYNIQIFKIKNGITFLASLKIRSQRCDTKKVQFGCPGSFDTHHNYLKKHLLKISKSSRENVLKLQK